MEKGCKNNLRKNRKYFLKGSKEKWEVLFEIFSSFLGPRIFFNKLFTKKNIFLNRFLVFKKIYILFIKKHRKLKEKVKTFSLGPT